ncbi:MAG: hypothetical protein R3322_06070 [Kiloniellales bacterium]|nr:hypothetical protein [Kiloniellales bacterium]
MAGSDGVTEADRPELGANTVLIERERRFDAPELDAEHGAEQGADRSAPSIGARRRERRRDASAGADVVASPPAATPGRFVQIAKWGGCFTALVFAIGGLLTDLVSSGDTYEAVSRGSWIIVAISMAFGLTGVVLDRSHKLPDSTDPTLSDRP